MLNPLTPPVTSIPRLLVSALGSSPFIRFVLFLKKAHKNQFSPTLPPTPQTSRLRDHALSGHLPTLYSLPSTPDLFLRNNSSSVSSPSPFTAFFAAFLSELFILLFLRFNSPIINQQSQIHTKKSPPGGRIDPPCLPLFLFKGFGLPLSISHNWSSMSALLPSRFCLPLPGPPPRLLL